MHRRELLQAAFALAVPSVVTTRSYVRSVAAQTQMLDVPQAFDYAWLKGRARSLASAEYQPPPTAVPEPLRSLDWDRYHAIRNRADHALWANEKLRFRVQLFHRGWHYTTRVGIYEVIDGQARELAYDPAMFDLSKARVDGERLPRDLGFAGLRINFHTDPMRDVAAFIGASYFRAVGGAGQYGISARGLAIDTGMDRAEEFPVFCAYWLERPAPESGRLSLYALLDSPSVTGAYRFDIYPASTLVMDIDAALYPRKPIARLGIAPLTSMFQCGENDRRMADDWRPEIHDSDGLSMWTGTGEWIWRPLTNPAGVRFNAYVDENVRGFGLLQRDRDFDHYQDDGAFYHRRPSLWVEPKAHWGKGSVQLVEIPTDDETSDNIVAFWNPDTELRPGQELLFGYRLHWGTDLPFGSSLARVVATRTGIGGIVGQRRKYFSWRFVVDFAGDNLPLIDPRAKVQPVITASRGIIEITSARPLESISGFRAMFDLRPTDEDPKPFDLRLYLSVDGQPLTETWIYQWVPLDAKERARYIRRGEPPFVG